MKPKNARHHYLRAHQSQYTRQYNRFGDVVMARHSERLLDAQWQKYVEYAKTLDDSVEDVEIVEDEQPTPHWNNHVQINPECAVGKHSNCSGTGWNIHQDEPAPCPCPCHAHE